MLFIGGTLQPDCGRLGDPRIHSMPQLEYVLEGMKRRTAGRASRECRPITLPLLRLLRGVWQADRDEFNCFGRPHACVSLVFCVWVKFGPPPKRYLIQLYMCMCVGDVCVDSTAEPQYLVVRIKASKTDPFREGVSVYLGRTKLDLCPVSAILFYMVHRGTAPGPSFRFPDPGGQVLAQH